MFAKCTCNKVLRHADYHCVWKVQAETRLKTTGWRDANHIHPAQLVFCLTVSHCHHADKIPRMTECA